jgi:hypothetical protein
MYIQDKLVEKELQMKTELYFRSMGRSDAVEDIVNVNLFNVLGKFNREGVGQIVVRLTRTKGGDLFRFPKYLCETVLSFGHKQIVIKKKSTDIKKLILESRFSLEKTLRRVLKKDLHERRLSMKLLA